MKRLLIGVLVGLAVGASGAPAQGAIPGLPVERAERAALRYDPDGTVTRTRHPKRNVVHVELHLENVETFFSGFREMYYTVTVKLSSGRIVLWDPIPGRWVNWRR